MRITVEEAAKQLGMPMQAIRVMMQLGKLPIGEVVKYKEKNHTYYIQQELVDKYLGKVTSQ